MKENIVSHNTTKLIFKLIIFKLKNKLNSQLHTRSGIDTTFYILKEFIQIIGTVGPRLSGHQLSGFLYYPAMILQYIVYCL